MAEGYKPYDPRNNNFGHLVSSPGRTLGGAMFNDVQANNEKRKRTISEMSAEANKPSGKEGMATTDYSDLYNKPVTQFRGETERPYQFNNNSFSAEKANYPDMTTDFKNKFVPSPGNVFNQSYMDTYEDDLLHRGNANTFNTQKIVDSMKKANAIRQETIDSLGLGKGPKFATLGGNSDQFKIPKPPPGKEWSGKMLRQFYDMQDNDKNRGVDMYKANLTADQAARQAQATAQQNQIANQFKNLDLGIKRDKNSIAAQKNAIDQNKWNAEWKQQLDKQNYDRLSNTMKGFKDSAKAYGIEEQEQAGYTNMMNGVLSKIPNDYLTKLLARPETLNSIINTAMASTQNVPKEERFNAVLGQFNQGLNTIFKGDK